MPFEREFVQSKSALEEVGKVLERIINLEASREEIKASNLKILTILEKMASKNQDVRSN